MRIPLGVCLVGGVLVLLEKWDSGLVGAGESGPGLAGWASVGLALVLVAKDLVDHLPGFGAFNHPFFDSGIGSYKWWLQDVFSHPSY